MHGDSLATLRRWIHKRGNCLPAWPQQVAVEEKLGMEERRRSPRHQVGGDFANLPANMSVRVIDISSAGVLLQSTHLLNPGSRGSLRFTLAGAPFAADIQVQRVSTVSDAGSGYRIGATFVGMTLEHRRLIERFMNND